MDFFYQKDNWIIKKKRTGELVGVINVMDIAIGTFRNTTQVLDT